MLVCPHCQFENPDNHRFCQKCGESLTETTCPACGKTVPFDAEFCPYCHTATGTVWKAILTPVQAITLSQGFPDNFPDNFPSAAEPIGKYLDVQQRYQLLRSLSDLSQALKANPSLPPEIEVQVLDRHPLQPSFLEALPDHPDATVEIPATAQPYLALQAQHPSMPLPQIHDAWQQDGVEIVLLEDRASLPLLLDFWRDEQILPLQILHWLHEMTELWAVLQPQHCCRSLLVLPNLRVDEDSLLCLQRFYSDDPQQPPQLKDLGQLWQTLFQQSQRTQWGDLARLYCDLESGDVPSLVELRSRIEEIAATLQPKPDATSFPLNPFRMDNEDALFKEATHGAVDLTSELPTTQLAADLTGSQPALKAAPAIALASATATMNDLESVNDLENVNSPTLEIPVNEGSLPSASPSDADSLPDENSPPDADSLPDENRFQDSQDQDNQDNDNQDQDNQDQDNQDQDNQDQDNQDNDDSPTIVLPMQLLGLEDAGATDIGRQRDHNEDSFSIRSEIRKLEGSKGRSLNAKGLYVLCDGMGGHAGGEVASALAVDTLQQYFDQEWQDKLPSQESIRTAILQANQAIYDRNQENARSGSGRMGTTLVLVLVQDTEVAIAHVGDSRLYRLSRRSGLERLTVDHEVGQREIQRGIEPAIAYARPDAYQLTQALGPRDENFVNPDVRFVELTEDTVLLLCSDGLTDNDLLEIYCQTNLEPLLSFQNSLELGVKKLIDLANQHNGHDNITAIAIRVKVRPNLAQFG